ncbi:MAG: lamin tail domain-containing protein [Akkermansiaceae bacterium]
MELVLGKITLACQDVEATLRLSFTISMNNFSQFTRLAVPIMALLFSGSFSKAAELLAYYNFDGQSADQSGNGANATLNGGGLISSDSLGFSGTAGDRALDLGSSGNGARADVNGDYSSATTNNAMAVSYWQYNIGNGSGGNASTTTFGIVSSNGGGNRGFQAHLPWGNGNAYFDHGGACCNGENRRSISIGTSTLNQWRHVVLQVAGGRKQLWIDGVMLDEQATGAAATPSFTGQLMIGAEPAGTNNGFGGRIDDFAVWASFLTPAEIASLAAGAPATDFDGSNTDLADLNITPAGAITSSGATLNGVVTDGGISAPTVTIYYGDEDGGQNEGSWDSSVTLPGTQSGNFFTNVTGLLPATTYHFGAKGDNAGGSKWATETETFATLPLAPAVSNLAAQNVEANSVTLGTEVTSTGGENPSVTIYYGLSDGGTNTGGWQDSVSLGAMGGTETTEVNGLTAGTTYFFRAFASNTGGDTWATASGSFTTPIAIPASVVNRSATNITGSSARLEGTVTDTGSDTPALNFYYGTSDGGTNPASWERSASAGSDAGDFSKTVSLFTPETTYYFRVQAQNSAGVSWAPDTQSFTTTEATALGVVINEVHYDADPKIEAAEFVELYNAGDLAVDLTGWSLVGVGNFVFPNGTSLDPGAYLVIAEDIATMQSKFGITTSHQYPGNLSVEGDDLRLLDSGGAEVDRVNYKAGFPWPSAARGTGASMELIHSALDNDLGASWRSSGTGPVGPVVTYLPPGSNWSYRKGSSEASNPVDAWRELTFFEDATWLSGDTPIGYGDGDDITLLGDMRNDYNTVYLRKSFTVPADQIPARLLVRVYCDDGAIIWINGKEVGRVSVTDGDKDFNDTGTNHEAAWEEILVNNASNVLLGGSNIIAVHALNASAGSSDFSIDAEVKTPDLGTATGNPTPGAANSVAAPSLSAAPPAIRQVNHTPEQAAGGDEVKVTALITDPDGVGPVTLSYQILDPGSYIRKSDGTFNTDWISVPMVDDGTAGDLSSGDSVFSATLPPALQVHRRVIRYRINLEDTPGNKIQVPYADDEQPNFAYFVYDGVPSWTAAKQPGSTATQTIPAEVMGDFQPVYHLIANSTDVSSSQYSNGSDGVRMWGTLVYQDRVYDHIQFYNRGEASTYVSGKNKWRFKFNRTHDFKARDAYGRRYLTNWKTLNFNSCASPWLSSQRGIAGVNEMVPHRLYQLASVTGSNTHHVHFRIIDDSVEAPSNQYNGDFWGLYQAIQHPDGRFLDEHGLADGNVYKIQGGGGNKKNQGPTQVENSSDWNSFYSASANLNTVAWWQNNFHLESYYGFRAINRATGNVDLRDTTNYYFYHEPTADQWRVIPWDLDMIYAPVKHVWSGVIRADRCLDHPEIRLGFRNRCRELGDLLFSDINRDGGHAAQLVEEISQFVNPSGEPLTMVDADEFMWSFHPQTRGGHRGPWYQLSRFETGLRTDYSRTIPTANHEGFQQSIIDYMYDTDATPFAVNDRDEDGYGWGYLAQEAADNAIPDTPTITYTGGGGFPVDGLGFQSSAFSDPQGSGTFASTEWRVGEIYNSSTPGYLAGDPWKYEIEEVWSKTGGTTASIPTSALRPGKTYRARVRHFDDSGRSSHWSGPIEFIAGNPDVTPYRDGLVISEVMYHPSGDELLEYLEIHNVGGTLLNLNSVRFTKGIDFDFPDGTTIAPGAFLLVVADIPAFEAKHGVGLPIAGQWETGDRLSNGGEILKLSLGQGTSIHAFAYDDTPPWPTAADGAGYSLTMRSPVSGIDHADPNNWQASVTPDGSPGTDDSVSLDDWLTIHGLSPGDELSDLDSDGISALVEYGTGTDPNLHNANPITVELVNGEFQFSYERSRSASGVSVEAEFSDNLLFWSPGVIISSSLIANGKDLVVMSSPLPDGSLGFARLKIVPTP